MPGKNIACLVDTDIAIDFLRGREYARKLLEEWAGRGLLAVSALTHTELYQGMQPGEKEATDAFLDGLVTIAVDVDIARKAGTLMAEQRRKGVTVSLVDAVIAATGLQHGVPLLTNNVEHYPFGGLGVVGGKNTKY